MAGTSNSTIRQFLIFFFLVNYQLVRFSGTIIIIIIVVFVAGSCEFFPFVLADGWKLSDSKSSQIFVF